MWTAWIDLQYAESPRPERIEFYLMEILAELQRSNQRRKNVKRIKAEKIKVTLALPDGETRTDDGTDGETDICGVSIPRPMTDADRIAAYKADSLARQGRLGKNVTRVVVGKDGKPKGDPK